MVYSTTEYTEYTEWMHFPCSLLPKIMIEQLHNPSFKVVEFDHFKTQAGLPSFTLNVALFGMTHQEWQRKNPDLNGNQRDYATINQLICISNMESINAVMINEGIPQPQRLKRLNEIAIQQMRILSSGGGRNLLK